MASNVSSSSTGQTLPEEVQKQLQLLDDAQQTMIYIIAGILLRYQNFTVQRNLLLDSALHPDTFNPACHPNSFQIQKVSSLLIIYALFQFYSQSKSIAREACEAGSDTSSAQGDLVLSETVIAVSLIRYIQILKQESEQANSANSSADQLAEEELEVPI